jgi:ATP adenylyltransferase
MEKLWAPWRLAYIKKARKPFSGKCFFCKVKGAKSDAPDRVVTRGRLSFSILNLYPYNNGHLMVAPYRHVGQLSKLAPPEWLEMLTLANDAIRRLERTMQPHGFNLGINLGRVSGAGIPGHLHLHIVPRWTGDTNFMPVLAGAKVISQSLDAAWRLLKDADKKKPWTGHKKRA